MIYLKENIYIGIGLRTKYNISLNIVCILARKQKVASPPKKKKKRAALIEVLNHFYFNSLTRCAEIQNPLP